MKQKTFRPPTMNREAPPKLRQTREGVQVLCPFCNPPHLLVPGMDSQCGTKLNVTAVQTIIPARTVRDKGLVCIKCHKEGKGSMVRYMNGFVHLEDCMPGTKILASPPKFNKLAEYVFKLPNKARAVIEKRTRGKTQKKLISVTEKLRESVEKRTGKAQRVDEIDAEGKETGKTLGYFFLKAG